MAKENKLNGETEKSNLNEGLNKTEDLTSSKEDKEKVATPQKEKYLKVRFFAKSDASQPKDIFLAVNGKRVVVERNKAVVLPERFLEAARNAVIDTFKQNPDTHENEKVLIATTPYEYIGEGTEEEYKKQLAEGNRKNQATKNKKIDE